MKDFQVDGLFNSKNLEKIARKSLSEKTDVPKGPIKHLKYVQAIHDYLSYRINSISGIVKEARKIQEDFLIYQAIQEKKSIDPTIQ